MNEAGNNAMSFDGLAAALRRHLPLVASLALLGGVVALLHLLYFAERTYQARADLLVKFGRDYVYQPEIPGGAGWQPSRMMELVNAEVQILNSRYVKQEVLRQAGVDRIYPDAIAPAGRWSHFMAWLGLSPSAAPQTEPGIPAAAIERFERDLNVQALGESAVVLVFFRHPDRETARSVLARLLDVYLKRRVEILSGSDPEATTKLVDLAAGKLHNAQDALVGYLSAREQGLSEAKLGANLALAERQQSVVVEAEARAADQRDLIERASRELQALLPKSDAPSKDKAQQELARALELHLRQTAVVDPVASADSVAMTALRAREAALTAQLRDTWLAPGSPDPVLRQSVENLFAMQIAARRRLALAEAERDRAVQVFAQLQPRIAALEHDKQAIETLRRVVAAAQEQYDAALRRNARETDLAALASIGSSSIRIIDAPYAATRPLGISDAARVFLAVLIGAFAGLCLTVLRQPQHRPAEAATGNGRNDASKKAQETA